MLQLYRYMWQPARYATREWLHKLGFQPPAGWHYGDNPPLDRSLDRALRGRLKPVVINSCLNAREQRLIRLVPRLEAYALVLGLMTIGCSDYFMLPGYRQVLLQWLTEDEIWRLYGWLGQKKRQPLSPQAMSKIALQIGTLTLHREAQQEPILQALLLLLPPPQRALWPKAASGAHAFVEHLL